VARILLLLAIGFAIWLLFRGFLRSQTRDEGPAPARDVEDMVACSRCGVNMPRSEAKEEGGKFTCRDPESCKNAK
jgi:formylmethanofuran dehydrogenase subunit E